MSWLDGLRDRWRWLTRSRQAEAQLDAELRFHLDLEAERLVAAGMSPDEAARRAARSLGDLGRTKEAVRDQRGISWIEDLGRDLGYAARGLRARPGFTAAVLATLALGIGANTAVFSVVEGIALRPLAYDDPGRLVAVWADRFVSQAETKAFRERSRTLVSIAAYAPWTMGLTEVDEPTQIAGARTSANLFQTLGVRAALGRTFRPDEDDPGAAPVAVLGHTLWRSRFGGDTSALGRPIVLDGVEHRIVGVMPPTFEVLGGDAAVWVPLPEDPSAWYYRSGVSLLIGRMASTVSLEAARADLARVIRLVRVPLGMPDTYGQDATLVDLRQYLTGDYRVLLLVLLGAVAGILLLAGANLANLLLSRATSRRAEMAMRLALGARRSRLVRQLLTEGLALSAVGAGLGLMLAMVLLAVFTSIAPAGTPRIAEVSINRVVLLVCAGLTLAMALVLGLSQAIGGIASRAAPGMRPGGGGDTRVTARAGGLLIVAETALAVTLIIGAGLMIRTLGRLAAVNPGFEYHQVLTLRIQPVYRDPGRVDGFYRDVFQRIEAIPGVLAVGGIQHLPLSGTGWGANIDIEGQPVPAGQERPRVGFRLISGNYLEAVGIPVLSGRGLDLRDGRDAPRVGLVNRAMAQRFWPGDDAVGRRLRQGNDTAWVTIVGVVGDVRHDALTARAEPELYRPAPQSGMPALMLAVRTSLPPAALARTVQSAVWAVDPGVPVAEVAPFDALLRASEGDRRLLTLVLAVFASVALGVGAIGVFGVTSFAVSRQTREIGIRMALGATGGLVRRAVFRRGLSLVGSGILLGVATALGLTRFLRDFLFEVGTTDPATFAGVVALLGAVAASAIAGPAFRATRVDPVRVLRED